MEEGPLTEPFASLQTLGLLVVPGEPLSHRTTLAVGGPADCFAELGTRDQLRALFNWARERGVPLFPIGHGSNLLVGDGGIRGVVVRLRGEFESLVFDGVRATAGAGVMLPVLARAAAGRGLSGAEVFVGIPGTVGGGLMTNAGTPDGDMGAVVESVEVMAEDGSTETWGRDRLAFSYRRSNLAGRWVLSATMAFKPGAAADITALMDAQLARRAERQPLNTRNCGSVFKNPTGDSAGRLIEAVGLKGYTIGGARISPKHANFIENTGSAAAADVIALIRLAKTSVKEKFGVDLQPEVWPVGEGSTI